MDLHTATELNVPIEPSQFHDLYTAYVIAGGEASWLSIKAFLEGSGRLEDIEFDKMVEVVASEYSHRNVIPDSSDH